LEARKSLRIHISAVEIMDLNARQAVPQTVTERKDDDDNDNKSI
jgi:hypothetical protein